MKKSVLLLFLFLFVIPASLVRSYASSPETEKKEKQGAGSQEGLTEYLLQIRAELAASAASLKEIHFQVTVQNASRDRKIENKINSLRLEYSELLKELETYKKYGTGNWKIFKMEFNRDVLLFQGDVQALAADVFPEQGQEELLAGTR